MERVVWPYPQKVGCLAGVPRDSEWGAHQMPTIGADAHQNHHHPQKPGGGLEKRLRAGSETRLVGSHLLPSSMQVTGSDTSLEASPSSSAGSLQATLEDSLTLSDSPRQRAAGPPPASLLGSTAAAGPSPSAHHRPPSLRGRGSLFRLRGLRGHQRSHSSGGSTSPGCTQHDSLDPSDEEGTGRVASAEHPEHPEPLALSLTSLFCPPAPPRRASSSCSLTGGPRAAPLARSPSWAAAHTKDPPPSEPQPGGLGEGSSGKRKR